jgi:uncharacterized protein (TIGR03437 family)
MGLQAGWAAAAVLAVSTLLPAQTLTNQTITGRYFFRQTSLTTDSGGSVTDARSIIGAITFNGSGGFTYTGTQVQGTNSAVDANGSGTYSVDPAGFVAMDSPVRAGDRLNARWGSDVLVGSNTESRANSFDMLVAVRAGSSTPVIAGGSFWMTSLEFPGGNGRNARNSFFNFLPIALGRVTAFAVFGHATNIVASQPVQDTLGGASYSFAADGTGSVVFGPGNPNALLSGARTFYVSADGNVVIGGSPGQHDILVGVKSPAVGVNNSSFNGNFWAAGLRFNPFTQPADVSSYAGALAARGQGTITWTRRTKSLSFGTYDFTGVDSYLFSASSVGIADLYTIALGVGGKTVLGALIDSRDPFSYEIYLGVQMPPLSGPGVFLNPQGVTSAASFFPPGAPISPGEFIALFGTGLAGSTQTAPPPYGPTLAGVSVSINGTPAPLYFVSPQQIDCLVPYATQGPTATIVVQNGSGNSNTVTVPVAATSPSVFSLNQTGTGFGAVLHLDGSIVDLSRPAVSGETVSIFLTGMGAVNPPVPDGTAGGTNPLSQTTSQPSVLLASQAATMLYSGLAPGFPGLYQINATLPKNLPGASTLPLSIQTGNAFHSMVSVPMK